MVISQHESMLGLVVALAAAESHGAAAVQGYLWVVKTCRRGGGLLVSTVYVVAFVFQSIMLFLPHPGG
jgi:hypothetical protein